MRTLATLFCGGTSDSLNPRKTHLLNESTGKALCGQHIAHIERVDCNEIDAENYNGSDACQKCLRKLSVPMETSDEQEGH